MLPRDFGHSGHRAVRLHARPVHQERSGLRYRLQSDESSELRGHEAHTRSDLACQRHHQSADRARRQQVRPRRSRGHVARGLHTRQRVQHTLHGDVGAQLVHCQQPLLRNRQRNQHQKGQLRQPGPQEQEQTSQAFALHFGQSKQRADNSTAATAAAVSTVRGGGDDAHRGQNKHGRRLGRNVHTDDALLQLLSLSLVPVHRSECAY